jgi:hypothetical protein
LCFGGQTVKAQKGGATMPMINKMLLSDKVLFNNEL